MSEDDCYMGHIRVQSQCGACGFSFAPRDRIVALINIANSFQVHDAYAFPNSIYCEQGEQDPWIYCRFPKCRVCLLGRESATIHIDCYNLFMEYSKETDRLSRLWTAATWRYPWRNAVSLCLKPEISSGPITEHIARLREFPQLKKLPPELTQMILACLGSNLICRYGQVLDLAHTLSSADWGPESCVSLHEITAWSRGDVRPAMPAKSNDLMIRLTIDAHGLRRVERYRNNSTNCRYTGVDDVAFVVDRIDRLSAVRLQLKGGFGRLQLSHEMQGLQIWDTSAPPKPAQLEFFPTGTSTAPRFATIDMGSCTGITFFINTGITFAVHAHTLNQPFARATFERLPPLRQRVVAWVYVPLTQNDTVDFFGIRMTGNRRFLKLRFLFHMTKTGTIAAGPYCRGPAKEYVLKIGDRATLVHDVPEIESISMIGASPANLDSLRLTETTPCFDNPFTDACFASAPLEQVVQVDVFGDEANRTCKGLIIKYENESQRSLGQCRVGLDSFQRHDKPRRLCFKQTIVYRPGSNVKCRTIKVDIGTSTDHDHEEVNWKCYPMGGLLQTWFSYEEMDLAVIETE